ncbi:4Fe-4S dicluster domain-containing protein [Mesosutterella sp. AGMB02718]|uniref:4Fe-4S dicluster domain-containing protein n=1 Tax=Mesosutterella faecium TaxID=2925194 RepID=A0ABT7IQN2_9BURK|nr:4Fe-4S dicluster domain-containing protein [Mesosutterella sp. AGMB02718]MDL2060213.1 4Fe-4S dicluster domain-containing protein [Mesosutterella sp. AGMB02718]
MADKETTKTRAGGPALSRREALAAAGGIAGMLALGGAAACTEGRPLVRPPGAAREKDFLALCIKCDRCTSACPLHAIGPASITDGFVQMRTPRMDFHHGWCNFCMKCTEACPTGALEPLAEPGPFDHPKAIGTAEITRNCIALARGGCTKCYEACNEGAITLNDDNVPVVDPELCTGCGLCVLVCPANVLGSFSGSSERGVEIRPPKGKKGGADK